MEKSHNESDFMLLHQIVHLSKYWAMKNMEKYDLKPSQAGILFILNCEGSLSQRELAEKIGITPPSMTVALKKMEKRGYILKEPDEKDQRIIRITLSPEGYECIRNLEGTMKNMDDMLYQGISPEEKMFLRRLLMEMRQNLLAYKEFEGMDIGTIMEKTRPSFKKEF